MNTLPGGALGLYLSVPFCRSKCTYCNFASGVYPAAEHARYVDRLIAELAGARAWAARMGAELPRRVDSVYLGGGTPTLLSPALLQRLFAALRFHFDLDPDAEITVECAPGQLPDETLRALLAAGVNRVSLGVQSFIDSEARACGRLHDRVTALADVMRLRAAPLCNLNIDLIAGLPGQTFASWRESLMVMESLADAGVPHASVYMLEVDEDSRLGREVLARGARYHAALVPSDDAIAEMYAMAIDRLHHAGLEQYEISNFSRPGCESRHNLRYWRRQPYLGLGLDASSMLREAPMLRQTPVLKGHGFTPFHKSASEVAPASRPAVRAASSPPVATSGPRDPHDPRPQDRWRLFADKLSVVPETPPNKARALAPEGMLPSIFSRESNFSRASGFFRSLFRRATPAPNPAAVLRSTTTDDLAAYLAGAEPAETAWLPPARQHEEAWFLGLRLNQGVEIAALEREFGADLLAPALAAVARLAETGLVVSDGRRVRLTPQGRLLSNEVFQQFLDLEPGLEPDPAPDPTPHNPAPKSSEPAQPPTVR